MEPGFEEYENDGEFAKGGVVETRGGDRLADFVPLNITPHPYLIPIKDDEEQ